MSNSKLDESESPAAAPSVDRARPFEPLDDNPYSTGDAVETAVVFDIEAEFAHFRKPHATTSLETFGIPPRTTIAGLLAGMLGLPRNSYYGLFGPDSSRIAVSLEAPVTRHASGMNLLDTKGSSGKTKGAKPAAHLANRIPTAMELLTTPRYRIYASVDSEPFMADLDAVLRGADPDTAGDEPVYTPALGRKHHLAWIDYVGRFPIEAMSTADPVTIRSAVPGETIPLALDTNARYVSERLPAYFEATDEEPRGRVAAGSRQMTYERTGAPLTLRDTEYALVGSDGVVFE